MMSTPRALIMSCVIGGIGFGVAGCAGGSERPVNVGVAGIENCQAVRQELRRYESRGIQYKADAAGRGARLTAKQSRDVARYNLLLDRYLGDMCHV